MLRGLILTLLMTLYLHASSYNVKYKGITLGEIESLETLQENYLKAEVTNMIAKLLIGKKYFILYEGEKPPIENAKFREDKTMVLFAFKESIANKPTYKHYTIDDTKEMTIRCGEQCTFEYQRKGKIKGRGVVSFDENGDFLNLTEEISTIEISRD